MVRGTGPLRVVMVDDDRDDIFLTKMAFKKAGFESEFLGLDSGEALFKYIKNNGIGSIDLLLLDVNMPLMNGHDILAELSAYPHFEDLWVTMFSTSSRTMDKSVSEQLGANEFVVKPSTAADTEAFIASISARFKIRELAIAS